MIMNILKMILLELTEIKKELQTITSSLESRDEASLVKSEFPRMRTSPNEPLSDKVVPHFTELYIRDVD